MYVILIDDSIAKTRFPWILSHLTSNLTISPPCNVHNVHITHTESRSLNNG